VTSICRNHGIVTRNAMLNPHGNGLLALRQVTTASISRVLIERGIAQSSYLLLLVQFIRSSFRPSNMSRSGNRHQRGGPTEWIPYRRKFFSIPSSLSEGRRGADRDCTFQMSRPRA
jgi:hypothetical protein